MTSEPPKRTPSNHDLLEGLQRDIASVMKAQSRQAAVESERVGERKIVARFQTVFGGVMTAAIIGTFAWAWNTNSMAQVQASRVDQISRTQIEIIARSVDTRSRVEDHDRTLAVGAQQSMEVLRRLELVETSNQEILVELRRRR